MSKTIPENSESAAIELTDGLSQVKVEALDQMLSDIRSGRRLERIVDSIKHFLDIQVSNVEQVLKQCEAAVDNDRRLKKLFVDFEKEKHQWSQARQAEIERLSIAGDKLIQGWVDLEAERRQFLDFKSQK